jgi:hypothetical protein
MWGEEGLSACWNEGLLSFEVGIICGVRVATACRMDVMGRFATVARSVVDHDRGHRGRTVEEGKAQWLCLCGSNRSMRLDGCDP